MDASASRFERIFRDHHDAVRAYALRRTDPATADDVVADTFLVCWRRLEAVPGDPLPWLYAVARRSLANRRRSAARAGAVRDRVAREPQPPSGREPADVVGERQAIHQALAALSERDREALRLWAWEGLDLVAGARAAGCTTAAFAVRLHRARRRLSARLADPDRDPTPEPTPELSCQS